MSRDRKTVVFWPDYSRGNPYQRLLYEGLRRDHDVIAGKLDAALDLMDASPRQARDLVFHLH